VVSRGLYISVARLWIHGTLYNHLDSGFMGLIYLYHLSADVQDYCLLSITGLTVGLWSPGEVLSVLYSLLSSRQERL